MKVYVVTSGVYSDYKIEAVFDSMDKAIACMENNARDEYSIEVFNTEDVKVSGRRAEERLYQFLFDNDGEVIFASCVKVRPGWALHEHPEAQSYGGVSIRIDDIYTDTYEKALKIARDERAMEIARLTGI